MCSMIFDASKWGTFSDLFTLIVTVLSTYFLIKTFRSQQEITRIEQANFRLRFLPRIVITFGLYNLTFKVEDQPIKKYDLRSSNINRFNYIDEWMVNGDRGIELHVGHSHSIGYQSNGKRLTQPYDTILISFLDAQNNLYKQSVYFYASTQELKIQTAIFIKNLKSENDFKLEISNI